jgi:hypothetical protein
LVLPLALAPLLAAAWIRADAGPAPPPSPSPAAPRASPAAGDEAERAERLRALPYSGWATNGNDGHAVGVTRYVRGAAFEGLNFFALTSRSEAWLVDMDGKRLHSWASARGQPVIGQELPYFFHGWQDVAVDAEGSLYAVVSRDRVLKLDSRSRLVWEVPLRAHHDVSLGPDGSVYTLADELRMMEDGGGRSRLVFDSDLVRIDGQGAVRSRISLLKVLLADAVLAPRLRAEVSRRFAELDHTGLQASLTFLAASDPRATRRFGELERALGGSLPADPDREFIALLRAIPGAPSDALHANAVRVLERAVPGLGQAGDLLVSIRELDLVAVVDPVRRRLRWSWGAGVLDAQHDPSVTPGGDLHVFDNRPESGASRVVQVAPPSGRIVWSLEGFFSRTRGGAQALPNGNVLVVESERGRAFEVTRAGDVVWEYYDPDEVDGRRLDLQQMQRIGGEEAARLRRRLGL